MKISLDETIERYSMDPIGDFSLQSVSGAITQGDDYLLRLRVGRHDIGEAILRVSSESETLFYESPDDDDSQEFRRVDEAKVLRIRRLGPGTEDTRLRLGLAAYYLATEEFETDYFAIDDRAENTDTSNTLLLDGRICGLGSEPGAYRETSESFDQLCRSIGFPPSSWHFYKLDLEENGSIIDDGTPPISLLDGETSEGSLRLIAGRIVGPVDWDTAAYRALWPKMDRSFPFGSAGFMEFYEGRACDAGLDGWAMMTYVGVPENLRRNGIYGRMLSALESLVSEMGKHGLAVLDPMNGVERLLAERGYETYHGVGNQRWMRSPVEEFQETEEDTLHPSDLPDVEIDPEEFDVIDAELRNAERCVPFIFDEELDEEYY